MKQWLCGAMVVLAAAVQAEVHPILFADAKEFAELRARCANDELAKATAAKIIAVADSLLPVVPEETPFVGRRKQTGRPMNRIINLSMAYQLTRDKKYAVRAIAEMRAGAELNKDWNPKHFLDTAMMTLGMATGYDWCYEVMSAEEREVVLKAILKMGLEPSETYNHWVNIENNWGQVCHAGILAGALLFREKDPELTKKFVLRAVSGLPHSMKVFAPNGAYPEGPLYWNYGMQYNVVAIELLERMEGQDFGLTKMTGFEATGDYLNQVTGPSGLYFDYADAAAARGSSCSSWWFAKRYNRPDIAAYYEVDMLRKGTQSDYPDNKIFFPFTLLWYRPVPKDTVMRAPLLYTPGGENEIVVMRTSWDNAKAAYVGLKAGTPLANHSQMDVGSFVFDSQGVRWTHDLDREDYNRIEQRNMNLWSMAQDSERWKIFRLNHQGHGILTMNGERQWVKGQAKVLTAKESAEGFEAKLDLTSLYPTAKRVMRTTTLNREGVFTVSDEIEAPAGAVVRWQVLTMADVKIGADGVVVLSAQGKAVALTTQHNFPTQWKSVDADSLKNDWDSPNPGMKVLSFEEKVPASGQLNFCVTFAKHTP